MADRRGVLVPLIILAFIFLSPDAGRPAARRFDDRPSPEDVIAEEQRSLSVLQNSSYGELVGGDGKVRPLLNLTGLEPDRGYAWEALTTVKARALEQLEYALGGWGRQALDGYDEAPNPTPLYNNVTGFLHGKWVRSKVQQSVQVSQLNLSTYAPEGPFGVLPVGSFGRNITGLGGDIRIRLHERILEAGPPTGWTASNVTKLGAEIAYVDDATSEEYELQAYGVYDMHLGQAILTTTSEKFAGIFAAPQFALSQHTFEAHKSMLNVSLSKVIQRQIDVEIESLNPWSSASENTARSPFDAPDCELIVWLQQLTPVASTAAYSSPVLNFLERELRFPTGAILPRAPEMKFSMLAFSPDCGYVLESKGPPDHIPQDGEHLTGPKIESLYKKGRHHLLLFAVAILLQMVLLKRQMTEASTPSTRSRISFYTIALMALGDGFATMTFLLISLFIAGLWVNLIGIAFLSFTSVSFFGMRFLLDIWTVQAPERDRRAREEAEEERQRRERLVAAMERVRAERRAAAGVSEPPTGEPPSDTPGDTTVVPVAPSAAEQTPPSTLPLPVTTQRPTDTGATPVFMPSDQEGLEPITQPLPTTTQPITVEPQTTSFASLYTRFYLLLLATLFLSLNASSWPQPIRRLYFTLLSLSYLSFWLPQIHRNIQRNCRHALNWEFVMGSSLLRLAPFAYIYGYADNVLLTKPDYPSLALLVVWLWIQVVVLGSQELIGPRWFICKDWAPPAYDYHPVLREDEEGGPLGMSSQPTSPSLERRPSLSAGTKAKTEKGKRTFDCAICFQDLEATVIEAGGDGSSDAAAAAASTLGGGLLARRNYMVTPCRHIFHTACLEGWMKYRLQCPICRETLPAL